MESSTNTEKRYAVPTIQSTPIYHDKGSEWTTVWFEKFAKLVRMLPESLFKKAMIEIVDNHAEYVPTFKTLQEVMHDYKIDDLENGKALSAALSKEISQEILGMKAVSSQCHATLVNTMAKCAKAMASADPEFKRNDECAKPNPVTTIIAMKRILITERDGKGTVRKLMTKSTSIADFLTTHQLVSEGLADFSERYVRKHKGLLQNYGLNVIGTIFADTPEYVLFWVFRLGPQYVQYQRDIENGIVQAPITLEEAVTAAKDRVEVTKKAHETVAPVSVFAAITGELPAKYGATRKSPPSKRNGNVRGSRGGAISIKRRNPLDPYPYMATAEYSKLSDADRAHVRDHNNAIREAMKSMERGKESKTPKPSVLAIDADDLEELDMGIVLMSHMLDDAFDDGMDTTSPVLFIAEVEHNEDALPDSTISLEARVAAYREYQSRGPTRIEPSRYMPKNPEYTTRYEQVYKGVPLRQQPEHHELCEVPPPTLRWDDNCWYIIGGIGSGKIVSNYDEIVGLTTSTYDYPRGHAEGFKSIQLAEDWGITVRKNLERLGMEAKDCVLLAYKSKNTVKVQQHPHVQPLARYMGETIPCIPHKGDAEIYDTLTTGEPIYNADSSRMRTYEWNGGEIPTNPEQYDKLAFQLLQAEKDLVSSRTRLQQAEKDSLSSRTAALEDHTVPPLDFHSDTESGEESCTNDEMVVQRDEVTPPKPSTARRNRRKRDKRLSRSTSPSTPPPELSGAMSCISIEAGATPRSGRYGEDIETPAAKYAYRVTNRSLAHDSMDPEQHHEWDEECYSDDEDNRSPPSLVSSDGSDSDNELESIFATPDTAMIATQRSDIGTPATRATLDGIATPASKATLDRVEAVVPTPDSAGTASTSRSVALPAGERQWYPNQWSRYRAPIWYNSIAQGSLKYCTEAELLEASESANQAIQSRSFSIAQAAVSPAEPQPDLPYTADTISAIHSTTHPVMGRSIAAADLDVIADYELTPIITDEQPPDLSATHTDLPTNATEAHLEE